MTVSRPPTPNNPYKERSQTQLLPDNEAGAKFFDLHRVKKHLDPQGNDTIFTGEKQSGPPQLTQPRMGYDSEQSAEVYENQETTQEDSLDTETDGEERTVSTVSEDEELFEEFDQAVNEIREALDAKNIPHSDPLSIWIGKKLFEHELEKLQEDDEWWKKLKDKKDDKDKDKKKDDDDDDDKKDDKDKKKDDDKCKCDEEVVTPKSKRSIVAEDVDDDMKEKIAKRYVRNEDRNYHGENVAMLAKHFGSPEDQKLAKEINDRHKKIGHLPTEDAEKRYALHQKLFPHIEDQYAKTIKECIEIEEISDKTKQFYLDKARPDNQRYFQKYLKARRGSKAEAEADRKSTNREVGIRRAVHSMKTAEPMDESLPPNATAKDYIDDFVHSKNKKFSGDSKKERIKRALGAFYKK